MNNCTKILDVGCASCEFTTMYLAVRIDNTITPVEVLRQTDHSVWVKHGHSEKVERKETNYHKYWDTYEQAKAHLLLTNLNEIKDLERRLAKAKSRIEHIEKYY